MSSTGVLLVMFGSFIALMLTGAPLAFVLGGAAFLFTAVLWGESALIVSVLNTYETMGSEALLAIPLYVLMATILQRSGIIEDLYAAMEKWFGRLPGGLAIGTVVICTIMAAMTGIVGAAVAAMGILALPAMLRRGYNRPLALGTICAGGTLGILIPPSVVTIVYAIAAQASIGKMFIAGIVPGIVLSLAYSIYIVIRTAIDPSLAPGPAADEARPTTGEKVRALKTLVLPGLIIVGVLGAIYTGIATPTEAAAVGVGGAMLSALFKRGLNRDELSAAAIDTLRVSAMILWITIGARTFIAVFTATGGADSLVGFVQDLEASRWVVLAAILGVLIFLGFFLDEIGIILLCVPVFLPVIKALDFDPLWFGVLFMITAQMAYITPPFGYTLFYMKGVMPRDLNMKDVYVGIIPYVLIQLACLLLFVMWPSLVTWLPNKMVGQ